MKGCKQYIIPTKFGSITKRRVLFIQGQSPFHCRDGHCVCKEDLGAIHFGRARSGLVNLFVNFLSAERAFSDSYAP